MRRSVLDFLSLNLLRGCNIRCKTCYAEGGPEKLGSPTLRVEEWKEAIEDAAGLKTRQIQFIGGEPLLSNDLLELAGTARKLGIPEIEVFTNATLLTRYLAEQLKELGVTLAVTLYSSEASVHDAVTCRCGSHAKTMRGLGLAAELGIPFRIAIPELQENAAGVQETAAFAESLGAFDVRSEPVRPFGRGVDCSATAAPFDCSACWATSLWIKPDGDVSHCAMRTISIGNISVTPLRELVLRDTEPVKVSCADGVDAEAERDLVPLIVGGCYKGPCFKGPCFKGPCFRGPCYRGGCYRRP